MGVPTAYHPDPVGSAHAICPIHQGVALLDGLEYDIQLLFSRFLGWLLLLFHTVIVAGISPAGGDEATSHRVSLAWLASSMPSLRRGRFLRAVWRDTPRSQAGGTGPGHVPSLRHLDPPARAPLPQHCCEVGSKARPLHDLIQGRLAMPMLGQPDDPAAQAQEHRRGDSATSGAPPNPVIWSSTSGTPAGMWTRCARR